MWNRHDHRPSPRRSVLWPLAVLALAWASCVGAATRPQDALPLSFVPNTGQTDAAVRFEVRGRGGHLFFSEREVVFSLPSNVLRLRFVEASPSARVVAGAPLPGTFNSFTGNDPSRWRRGLPTYDGVVYRGLYPGVDLVYEGREGTLKGTYTLAPGVDPALVRWRYEGASALRIDGASGDLHVVLPDGSPLVERAPVAWQELDGAPREVDVRFVLVDASTVGFRVGRHDPQVPLTIDPALVYSTYLGGNDLDEADDLAVDSNGLVYLTGQTVSSNFPLASPFRSTSAHSEAFVSKLDPAANVMIYSTYLGGEEMDYATAIAVENDEVYVTGATDSQDFPLMGSFQGFGGLTDAFVVKLDGGGGLLASSYLGGSQEDVGTAIAVDSMVNEVAVAGHTYSPDFPVANAWQGTKASDMDFFITRLDASLGGLVVSTYFGAEGMETAPDLTIDVHGFMHLAGTTTSQLLPTLNAPQPVFGGGFSDAVLARFDDRAVPFYVTYLGGSDNENGVAVAVDSQGESVVVGTTRSWDFPVVNAWQPFLLGLADAFVTRYDQGGGPVYSTFLGGSSEDGASGVAVDGNGFAYVTGGTDSSDFPLVAPWQSAFGGFSDAFVTVLDVWGRSLLFSSFLGGSGTDWGAAVAAEPGDLAYVAGYTNSYNFPIVSPWQSNLQGGNDAFLSILDTEASRCREIFSPAEIPSPSVIDFDSFTSPFNVIGTGYLASHGVTFEDSSVTKALVVDDPAVAASSPQDAVNDAVFPYNSANVPMKIDFSSAKTHVGMWVGNGGFASITAVLTAFDGAGNVLCQSVRPGVPYADTMYVGLHDPLGRIRQVTLDYGNTWLSESIDDLSFAP